MTPERFPERNRMILKLVASGLTYAEVAKKVGATRSAVRMVMSRHREREDGIVVKRGPRTKANTLMRAKMARLYTERQWTAAQIATEFRVSETAVLGYLRHARVPIRGAHRRSSANVIALPKPSAPARLWCQQCERNVVLAEAASCVRAFCKAKAVAA